MREKSASTLARILVVAIIAVGVALLTRALPTPVLAGPPTSANAAPSASPQQFPIMDRIADKIVQKYQTSSCEQLWQEKAQAKNKPKSAQEQEAINLLKSDAQMRQAFINKIAAPIANKMFECGMIP